MSDTYESLHCATCDAVIAHYVLAGLRFECATCGTTRTSSAGDGLYGMGASA